MHVSYSWLQSYFENPLPPVGELVKLLTMHSNEVESVEEIVLPSGAKDTVLDLKILPSRAADLLCYWGIAREIAVLLDVPLKSRPEPLRGTGDVSTKDHITLSITDEKLCRRAMKRYVEGVKVGPSPTWMVDRLAAMGQRSINNVVDATNYVMFAYGQSGHAFDYDKLAGQKDKKIITVRAAHEHEKVTTLDGGEYTLDSSMCVIADEGGPQDIAGIKGGMASAITESTTRVMLSACSFNPSAIRKTSQKLGLRSDSSKRFENNIARELPPLGLAEISRLVAELAGGKLAEDVIDLFPAPRERYEISTTLAGVGAILGTTIPQETIEDILSRFQKYAGWRWHKDAERYVITAPFERSDMYPREKSDDPYAAGVEADVVEEIGRVYGLENIPGILPKDNVRPSILPLYYWSERLRSFCTEHDFSEVMTYAFVSQMKAGSVELENPLDINEKYLRTTIAPQLVESLKLNIGNKDLLGLSQVKIFEIGHVFTEKSERVHCAVAVESPGRKTSRPTADGDSGLGDAHFEAESIALDLQRALSLPSIRYEMMKDTPHGVLEFDLEDIVAALPSPEEGDLPPPQREVVTRYQPFSMYPFVVRDIAVWTAGEREELSALLQKEAGELLVRLSLFDEFSKDGKTSYAYRLVFQSLDRTLTSEEVDVIMQRIYATVKARGWAVR